MARRSSTSEVMTGTAWPPQVTSSLEGARPRRGPAPAAGASGAACGPPPALARATVARMPTATPASTRAHLQRWRDQGRRRSLLRDGSRGRVPSSGAASSGGRTSSGGGNAPGGRGRAGGGGGAPTGTQAGSARRSGAAGRPHPPGSIGSVSVRPERAWRPPGIGRTRSGAGQAGARCSRSVGDVVARCPRLCLAEASVAEPQEGVGRTQW
jgi:hypothetical protein